MDVLPDDVVARILGRLPPCTLAASCCVCRRWRAVVDRRRLLPSADLLPIRLFGFFFVGGLTPATYFFSRPSTARRIGGRLDFLAMDEPFDSNIVLDQCNGLLLFWERVANPATRQSVRLPPFPERPLPPPVMAGGRMGIHQLDIYHDYRKRSRYCLVYDPMYSAQPHHYEVFQVPHAPCPHPDDIPCRCRGRRPTFAADAWTRGVHLPPNPHADLLERSEWPPSPYALQVFSSRTWRWEERSFTRQGEPLGTIADMNQLWHPPSDQKDHVYFRGALYMLWPNDCVMRLALSGGTYQMIKPPNGRDEFAAQESVLHLGKSEKGVYCTLLADGGYDVWPQCRIWLLNEMSLEWVLKTSISLQNAMLIFHLRFEDECRGPWIVNYRHGESDALEQEDVTVEGELKEDEFNFAKGVVPGNEDNTSSTPNHVFFLGFHPYKEIAFFLIWEETVVAYNLNSSRAKDLGIIRNNYVRDAFPYTPCWTGDLSQGPDNN